MRLSPRILAREWHECPGTIVICLLWVLVFAGMAIVQASESRPTTWQQWVYLGITDGHRFGDCSLPDLERGEVWRLVTSTFVHYNVLHIALNLLIMYQLGAIVEGWYGTGQFLFLYLLTGGGGNGLSVVIRHLMKNDVRIHWGGGSVVIMGLVALCCVVGLRNRKVMGGRLGMQMLFVLAGTALLGVILPRYVDNWGHAGGAIVGAVLGFADRWMLNQVSRPSAWGNGVIASVLMVCCGIAQYDSDRRELPLRRQDTLARRVLELDRAARRLNAAKLSLARSQTTDGLWNAIDSGMPELSGLTLDELERLRAEFSGEGPGTVDASRAKVLSEGVDRLIAGLRRELVADQHELRDLRERSSRSKLRRGR